MTPASARSRKVRRILAVEARARRLQRCHDRVVERAVRMKAEVYRLLDQARGIEWELSGGQLAELRRARAARGVVDVAETSAAPAADEGRGRRRCSASIPGGCSTGRLDTEAPGSPAGSVRNPATDPTTPQ